jgi:acyl-coenzyme A thioesterase PaaI-like protein
MNEAGVDAFTGERRWAAAAARDLARLLVTSVSSTDELTAIANELTRLTEGLAQSAVASRYDLPLASDADAASAYRETHPLLGPASPIAPPLRLESSDRPAAISGMFDARFEGPPGLVHGGFVAFGFEFVLGMAAASTGLRAFSVSTTIRYRKPLRVGTPVLFEAAVDRVDGRKVFTQGTLTVDGEVSAQAEGLHITVDEATWNQGREKNV